MLLQSRSRTVLSGLRLGGLASVAFEVLLPVLFIAVMCLVKKLPTVPLPPQVFREYLLADDGWAKGGAGALLALLSVAAVTDGWGSMTRQAVDTCEALRHACRLAPHTARDVQRYKRTV